MKRWALLLALAAPAAHAGPVTPPAGWTVDGALAVKLTQAGASVPHFGGLPSIVTTEVHRSGKATLFVHRISAGIAGATAPMRDRAATTELQELPAAARRAGTVRLDPAPKLAATGKRLEGALGWSDDTTAVLSMHRMVIAADEQQLIAVHGECVMPRDEAALRKACGDALLSLDPGIAPDRQVALSLIELPPEPPPAGSASRAPSLVESGERPSLPPMQIPQEPRETDRRPVYVGLGLIVLAALFYWNRKNREKLEREYEQRTADKPPAAPDRDADDLHAAASSDGERTKEPEA